MMSSSADRQKSGFGAVASALFLTLGLICAAIFPSPASALEAHDYKMAGDAARMRVVMNFDAEPDPKWFLLRGPHRLVIDLPKTKFAIDPKALKARGLVRNVRYGHINDGNSRLILEAKGPFVVEKLDILPNEGSSGYRMVGGYLGGLAERIRRCARRAGADDRRDQATPKSERLGLRTGRAGQRFTIVIDPGHGGIDGGAAGLSGTVEKDDHADLRRGTARQAARRRPIQRLHDAREGRVPAPRRPGADCQGARGRPLHLDPCRHDQAEGHSRRHRLHRVRQGVGRRRAGAGRPRKPLRPARRHRCRGRGPPGRRHTGRSDPARDAQLLDALRPLAGRRTVDHGRPDQQSAPFRRLQGAEGAGRAVGAARARLSVERQGRGAAQERRMARQGGRKHVQGDRAIRDRHRAAREADRRPPRAVAQPCVARTPQSP